MIFQAKTLEEAYLKASEHFGCSVTEFESISVIQAPSNILFGFIKKDAIVEIKYTKIVENEIESVEEIIESTKEELSEKELPKEEKEIEINVEESTKEEVEEEKEVSEKIVEEKLEEESIKEPKARQKPESIKEEVVFEKDINVKSKTSDSKKDNKKEVLLKIEEEINELFAKSCFKLEKIKVSYFDRETLFIEFQGDDSALLIGKEGYRYNALSYMLFNWINQKYGFKIRLEVAEFLYNQETMMNKLLTPIIEEIELTGKTRTKPFDGILIHIALDALRKKFPTKYVGVKFTKNGEKYIIVNEFLKKDD